jgi:hypothetical protein
MTQADLIDGKYTIKAIIHFHNRPRLLLSQECIGFLWKVGKQIEATLKKSYGFLQEPSYLVLSECPGCF